MTRKQKEMWKDRGENDAEAGKSIMTFYDYGYRGNQNESVRACYEIGYRSKKESMRKAK
jgi:hypothetical protein